MIGLRSVGRGRQRVGVVAQRITALSAVLSGARDRGRVRQLLAEKAVEWGLSLTTLECYERRCRTALAFGEVSERRLVQHCRRGNRSASARRALQLASTSSDRDERPDIGRWCPAAPTADEACELLEWDDLPSWQALDFSP